MFLSYSIFSMSLSLSRRRSGEKVVECSGAFDRFSTLKTTSKITKSVAHSDTTTPDETKKKLSFMLSEGQLSVTRFIVTKHSAAND